MKKNMHNVLFIIITVFLFSCSQKKNEKTFEEETNTNEDAISSSLSLEYEYIGKAIEKKGTHVWGSSPVIDKEGKVHLYVAEWPMPTNENEGFSGWYHHSRVAHYVSDKPEGPYEFVRIAVEDQDGKFNAPHNPTVQYIDGKYVLLFIVNENNDKTTQRIIMYIADDLNDSWRPANGALEDGTILWQPIVDSTYWNHGADRGVSNPSLVKFRDKYMLYFKSVIPDPSGQIHLRKYGYGVAVSKELEGPYKMHKKRITPENLQLEDAYAFSVNNKMYMLSRDFRGTLGHRGGGLLWTSRDGLLFTSETTKRAFEPLEHYLGKEAMTNFISYRGKMEGDLERPQILMKDGKPEYLFVATGINNNEGFGSCSHVFKLNMKD